MIRELLGFQLKIQRLLGLLPLQSHKLLSALSLGMTF